MRDVTRVMVFRDGEEWLFVESEEGQKRNGGEKDGQNGKHLTSSERNSCVAVIAGAFN